MTIVFIILGILMIISGFVFMVSPLVTFLNVGYFVAVMALVYGISGIFRSIAYKRYGLLFAFDILSVLFGVIVLCFPQLILVIDGFNLVLAAVWFILMGIVAMISAIKVTKPTGSSLWILQLIFGILGIIIGISSFFEPLALAISIGFLIGIYFIEAGVNMIIIGSVAE
ncbi:MAG: DUF308 domain-containing protein [Clostridia bacterium]|nr:DUF308 domain-containing protein [Clostridia bacterium]